MTEILAGQDISRRNFLRGALFAMGGAAIATAVPTPALAMLENFQEPNSTDSVPSSADTLPAPTPTTISNVRERSEHEDEQTDGDEEAVSFWNFPEWYEQLGSPDQTIAQSIGQALVAEAYIIPPTMVLSKMGVPIGNAGLMQILDNPERLAKLPHAVKLFPMIAIVAPITEELGYRAFPSAILNWIERDNSTYSTTSSALPFALGTSAWFAHAHNKGAEEKAIPMPQFAIGMLFWRQQRNAGVTHSIAAHAATNALLAGLSLPLIESKRKAAIAEQANNYPKDH